jgi:hypothetical protein
MGACEPAEQVLRPLKDEIPPQVRKADEHRPLADGNHRFGFVMFRDANILQHSWSFFRVCDPIDTTVRRPARFRAC